jgi:hypothetical protein
LINGTVLALTSKALKLLEATLGIRRGT